MMDSSIKTEETKNIFRFIFSKTSKIVYSQSTMEGEFIDLDGKEMDLQYYPIEFENSLEWEFSASPDSKPILIEADSEEEFVE